MENFFELNSLEEFYSQNPDSIIFSFLAHEYIKSGNYEKACEVAEKGIRKYPNYAYGFYVVLIILLIRILFHLVKYIIYFLKTTQVVIYLLN